MRLSGALFGAALLLASFAAGRRQDADAAGGWLKGPDLPSPLAGVTATLLSGPNCGTNCGKVLVAGGGGPDVLYDPWMNRWMRTVNSLGDFGARDSHTATLLDPPGCNVGGGTSIPIISPPLPEGYPCGQVLVAGGLGEGGGFNPINTAYLFDPKTAKWGTPSSLSQGRYLHTATLLPDGRVLVACGYNPGILAGIHTAELFDWSAPGKWVSNIAPMTNPRYGHTATLLTGPNCGGNCGKVILAGGGGSFGAVLTGPLGPANPYYQTSHTSELYTPSPGGAGVFVPSGRLPLGKDQAAAVELLDGKVLVGGGGSWDNNPPLDTDMLYSPAHGEWTLLKDATPGEHTSPAMARLPDGLVVLTGGSQTGKDAELFKMGSAGASELGTWQGTPNLPDLSVPRQFLAGSLLSCDAPGARFLVMGGGYESNSGTHGFSFVTVASTELLPRTFPRNESVEPASGPVKGGTPVTIRGLRFYPGTPFVTFGGVPAFDAKVDPSGTAITATSPPHPRDSPRW